MALIDSLHTPLLLIQILSENSCHFVNLLSLASNHFQDKSTLEKKTLLLELFQFEIDHVIQEPGFFSYNI